ncbi:MAG: hypothetical protein COB24_08285 [Hyphomicrobiales bacterium]|nr:MAG: hypothetical protein COB24_08285 [Hyphomicrobiales bacterium]
MKFAPKLIIASIALSLSFITPTFAETISIQGTGIVTSAPDIAYINLGVNSSAQTARIALDKNNKAMNNIINAIKKIEVENKDIQTSNFSINPRYNRVQNQEGLPEIIGYEVFNNLNITIRNLDELGAILDKVVTLGSNRINNIQFAIANPQPLEDQARALAAKDAKRRAEIYAATLGFNLGKIIEITEGRARNQPLIQAKLERGTMMMDAAAPNSAPIEAGEQAITSNVTVIWNIAQ